MSRVFQLLDADDTIDLMDSTSGIATIHEGYSRPRMDLGMGETSRIVERWQFSLQGSDHDDVADQWQTLTKLARRAKEHQSTIWRTKPVYLKQQTKTETNERYALVYEITDLQAPDIFEAAFEGDDFLKGFAMTVVREHPWRSTAPETLPTVLTLGGSDGTSSATMVQVANFRDEEDVDTIKIDDGGVYGSNMASTAAFDLFPDPAAGGDRLYIGSAAPWKHIVFDVGTAGNFDANIGIYYWNGAWTLMEYGVDYAIFAENGGEVASEDDIFQQTGQWVINVFPPADWTTTTIDGDSKYWIHVRVVSVSTWTTTPANATNG